MATNPLVNTQITDAVTQTTTGVVGAAPSQSIAMLYQSMAHAVGLSMQNATTSQAAMQQLNIAVVSQATARILAMAPASPQKKKDPNSPDSSPHSPS